MRVESGHSPASEGGGGDLGVHPPSGVKGSAGTLPLIAADFATYETPPPPPAGIEFNNTHL